MTRERDGLVGQALVAVCPAATQALRASMRGLLLGSVAKANDGVDGRDSKHK